MMSNVMRCGVRLPVPVLPAAEHDGTVSYWRSSESHERPLGKYERAAEGDRGGVRATR